MTHGGTSHDGFGDVLDEGLGEVDGLPSFSLEDTEVAAAGLRAYGSSVGGVSVPHEAPGPLLVPRMRPRERREELDRELLSPGAALCEGAGERAAAEEPDAWRTAFECDLDRVRHCKPFRRLAGKTQVFIAASNEHLRNRLTHAVEVSQVAGAIARGCGLNVALTEAVALGHDCGHGPAGHASEEAFAPYLPAGFDHALWGADVTLAPLNLCAETLDGIRNHSWRRPVPATAEGVAVALADRIAYCAHDFDDAVRAGIVTFDDLPREVASVVGVRQGEQVASFVTAVLDAAAATGVVGLPQRHADALAAFRRFNFEQIYLRPAARRQAELAVVVLRTLVDRLVDEPALLGAGGLEAGSDAAARAAVEWVSGMTDRFAFAAAVELCGWDPERLPRAV